MIIDNEDVCVKCPYPTITDCDTCNISNNYRLLIKIKTLIKSIK